MRSAEHVAAINNSPSESILALAGCSYSPPAPEDARLIDAIPAAFFMRRLWRWGILRLWPFILARIVPPKRQWLVGASPFRQRAVKTTTREWAAPIDRPEKRLVAAWASERQQIVERHDVRDRARYPKKDGNLDDPLAACQLAHDEKDGARQAPAENDPRQQSLTATIVVPGNARFFVHVAPNERGFRRPRFYRALCARL